MPPTSIWAPDSTVGAIVQNVYFMRHFDLTLWLLQCVFLSVSRFGPSIITILMVYLWQCNIATCHGGYGTASPPSIFTSANEANKMGAWTNPKEAWQKALQCPVKPNPIKTTVSPWCSLADAYWTWWQINGPKLFWCQCDTYWLSGLGWVIGYWAWNSQAEKLPHWGPVGYHWVWFSAAWESFLNHDLSRESERQSIKC